MIRVAIADDHNLLTDSLKMVLENYREIEIAGTAHNGLDAVELCRKTNPEIILLDIRMPLMDGVEAVSKIKEINPSIKVIILTSLEESKAAVDSYMAGADAYILKDTPPEKLKTLIECVSWGFTVANGNIKDMIRYEFMQSYSEEKATGNTGSLREDDIDIIRCISEGKSNAEIAAKFGYADGTVKNRVTRLLEMTGTGNRAQLVMYALKQKLI